MAAQATPTKLRDDSWGATVRGRVAVGSTIVVTARSGKTWTASVYEIVWSGPGVTIVRTEAPKTGRQRRAAALRPRRSSARAHSDHPWGDDL